MSVGWATPCSTIRRTSWDEEGSMPEVGEAIAVYLIRPLVEECAFEPPSIPAEDPTEEPEHVEYDDLDSAAEVQANDGGKLGDNLERGSPKGYGTDGTFNKIYL